MRSMHKMTHFFVLVVALAIAAGMSLVATPAAYSQVSVSTGSISGTVTDPQGATVPDAKVVVSNKETGTSQTLNSGSAGLFSAGGLTPATYAVRIEAKGFKTFQSTVVVQVGQITSLTAKLEIGDASII